MPDNEKDIAVLQVRMESLADCSERIKETIRDLEEHNMGASEPCRRTFVSRDRYAPVEKLVYSLVSLILLGVVGAILSIVLKK